jgi:dynein heavy chain, axonemal
MKNRINRILESPRGNALLVGVGGSGKQSLARIAAFISGLEVFQVQLRRGYGIADLKVNILLIIVSHAAFDICFFQADLASLYVKAGLKNIGTVFIMTDGQVIFIACNTFNLMYVTPRASLAALKSKRKKVQ